MTVEKIEIGKSVEALHEWNKLALTVTVPPGEDPQKVFFEAKSLLDKLLPGVDSGRVGPDEITPPIKLTNEQRRQKTIEAHVKTINECTTLKNLEMFSNMVQRENIDVLYDAFHNKKKQLQQ